MKECEIIKVGHTFGLLAVTGVRWGVDKTRNIEHSGTYRNIPEHTGTYRNIPEHTGTWKNITTFKKKINK